jgi:4a-hydroxytetrahydrobiopterin dehydratase
MAQLLTDAEIAQRLEDLDGWAQQGAQIRRTFQFGSFPAAIAFVTQVAFAAEAAGHHPDIDIRYRKVTLALTTHDAGGLTDKDFTLAALVEDLLG